ncbi:glyoxalase [Arthrobacter livingstonensis]|uniref:Glyoxalase n=1 Tax=Arthrobacter livingstonensis TaxID=670078 RepID=A0A2V5L8A8_9MICC|nr:VOC family protein [Arthrobacter livingstonensis]PYI67669.1 glyoxalase [Arthrobacter livingstonensis]
MKRSPIIVSLPIADRRKSFAFYTTGLGLHPVGEPADDGVPEPLQFRLNDGLRLMLIPTGGFGWVVGNRMVAQSSHSECFISITAGSESGVDELVLKAQQAGGAMVTEPTQQPWGHAGAFTDPDGHVWQVTAGSPPD